MDDRVKKEFNNWLRTGPKIEWKVLKEYNKVISFIGNTNEEISFLASYSMVFDFVIIFLYEMPDFGGIDEEFKYSKDCKKFAFDYLKKWKLEQIEENLKSKKE